MILGRRASSLAWAVTADPVHGVALIVAAGEIDHVQDQGGPLDVPEERVAESGAAAGALDQARYVRYHEAVLTRLHHTEVRNECGERVVGDLGPRGAHVGDQRRLPHAGEADERGVGEQLQLE
jgi:hypothetical protein